MIRWSRPRGTQDFLPPDSERKREVERLFRELVTLYGYREVETPIFEHTEIFLRSAGMESDIVTKEMYNFLDRSERQLTLRPEGTPGVVRAVLESKAGPVRCRLFYIGPFFRYGRPQKGRLRQFHQLGVEALGEASPLADAELIFLGEQFFSRLGIADCVTHINSIGCQRCRPGYRQDLLKFLKEQGPALCSDCSERALRSPLRVFDCKNPACQAALAEAPKPSQHLCPECAEHFRSVVDDLKRRGVRLEVDERLVRGLDYYNRTTFEYVSATLGAQNSLGGGGRYDYLVEELGGPATPAVGFALGLERTMLAMPQPGQERRQPLVFVVWLSQAELGPTQELAERLRAAGIPCRIDFDSGKVARQFKVADSAQASYCVIVGSEELARGCYSLKNLMTGEQVTVPAGSIVEELRRLLGSGQNKLGNRQAGTVT
ncbi:MAG: histidine--tRNA ligase [candidate division WOR-3 bacterium]